MQPRVLLAAIDPSCREPLAARLGLNRSQIVESADVAALMLHVRRSRPTVVVLGPSLVQESSLPTVVKGLRAGNDRVAVILLADHESEALAVAALRAGVSDYFRAPFPIDDLLSSIRRELGSRETCARPQPVAGAPLRLDAHALVGDSASIREIKTNLARLAASETNVLITGETGTGKELAAELIHSGSHRRHDRFLSINCAAIPETLLESELFGHERGAFTGAAASRAGLLQQAQHGTVFLDEVGDMSPLAQAKVLRAIESREIVPLGGRIPVPLDVRIIAATNHDLDRAVKEGRFRRDLFFRLNVVRLHLPPLRERSVDVPALLLHYAKQFARRSGGAPTDFTDAVVSRLRSYSWPGNVRELKNLVEAILAFAPRSPIDVQDLPRDFIDRLPPATHDDDLERQRVLAALLEARWNKSKAARHLRCSRMTLYRRLTKLGLVTSGT